MERALAIFNNILDMNPNDNQGVRALAIDCYFRLRRPLDALGICDRYPDDGMGQVLYGCALALYQLERKEEAEKSMLEAIAFLPLVAGELVKERHKKPKDTLPGYVTLGGIDQAYFYWLDRGERWENTPEAIDFLRDCLQEYGGV